MPKFKENPNPIKNKRTPYKMNGYTYQGISPVKQEKKKTYIQGEVPSEKELLKAANDPNTVKDADYYAWQKGLTPA